MGNGLSILYYYQPWTRRKIPYSWKLFAIWKMIEIPLRVPPLTQQLVRALASYELSLGNLEMATILLLNFYCLLRIGRIGEVL